MVSWRKLFNKFLFLKSASPPVREEESFFSFSFHDTRFQSPFSFTIHLHSLIRVSRRDKKKHFEIQITRGYSARGTRCPPTARLVVHFANTPLSSILTGTSKHRIAATSEAWHRPFWSARHVFGYFLRQTDERINNGAARTPPVHLSPAFTVSFKFPTYQNFSSVSLCFHSSFQLSFTVLVYYRSLIQYLELSVVYQTFWTLISKNSTLRKHKDGIYHRRPTSSQDCHLVS